jgi:ABC-2 type transport system ATP-binding protein
VGKTTTMRMILGLDAPTRGSVTVGGLSVAAGALLRHPAAAIACMDAA